MSKQCPAESSAGHGLPPQRAPKQCPANGVRRIQGGLVSRHGLLDTVKKHMADVLRLLGACTECGTADMRAGRQPPTSSAALEPATLLLVA